MGSLSNLYISQSYQSLIHLATNNTASATLIDLQDGLGNSIGVSVNTSGDLSLSGSFTASLQQGYLYVGNASGKTTAFATSSLVATVDTGSLVTTSSFNSYTQSTNIRLNNLESTSASVNVSISNLNSTTQSLNTSITNLNSATASLFTSASLGLTTASFSGNTLTFTKGNGTTFGVIIPDVSGSTIDTGSFATTGSNTFVGANNFSSSVDILGGLIIYDNNISIGYPKQMGDPYNTNVGIFTPFVYSPTGSLLLGGNQMTNSGVTILKGLGVTGSVVISPLPGMTPTGGNLDVYGTFTSSLQEGYVWVGNASGRTTTVATSSFAGGGTIDTGSLVTTASFNSYTQSNDQRVSSLESNSASVNTSITNINSFTQSAIVSIDNINLTTASLNTSISNINTFTQSTNVSISNLNTFTASQSTASLVTSIDNLNQFSASTLVSISNLNTNSASVNTSITNLNTATSSLFTSASLAIVTASVSGQNLTFTKGNGTTFDILIPTASYFTSSISVSGSITISGSIENVDYIDFNTASAVPTWKSGRVFWDNTDGCLGVYNAEADITLQVGQEMWVRARNNTGVTIENGAAVRLVGALGDNPLIVLAQSVQVSGSAITDNQILGLATHTIETGTDGYVTTLGNVRGLNTSAFAQGDVLFVSSSAGLLTNVIPVAPYERIPVATVVKVGPGGSGILYVAPQPPIDFSDLSSVLIEGDYENDDVWIYEGNVWKHKSKSDIGLTTTASFNAYTSSNDAKVNSLIAATGSYATTGSNTFTGDQTLTDAAGNTITLTDTSGSLMLVMKGFTSSSLHLSASASGTANLIFKTNNNTADTIISGSSNLFVNPAAPTAGFKRYIGNGNIALGAFFPQISGSMQFSPTINANYLGANIIIRGPVSASAMNVNTNVLLGTISIGQTATLHAEKLTFNTNANNNFIAGQLNLIANQSNIGNLTNIAQNNINGIVTLNLSSSATIFAQNTINDGAFTLTNQFSSGSLGFGQVTITGNTIAGSTNQLIATGSQTVSSTQQARFNENLIVGNTNIGFVNSSESRISGTNVYHQLLSTSLLGQRLVVTGSSNTNDTTSFGSVFVGRFNSVDGIRNKSSDIIFAVGTGTNITTGRKTGFLIDSGSNTFVEGSLNVSGSTRLTGSLSVTGSNTIFSSSVSIRGNTTFTSADGTQGNIILGDNAMANAVGNTTSVAIGGQAMRYASGSQQNVALGQNALIITSGSNNFGLGSYTLENNTLGSENVALGTGALNKNTTGQRNIGIGNGPLFFNTEGERNIGIGYNAGANASGSNNIFIGYEAGGEVSGSRNVIIGAYKGTAGELRNDNVILSNGSSQIVAQYNGEWQFPYDVNVTGSVSITQTLQLSPLDPLPAGTVGMLAVSGSNLFFYNGAWTQVI